MPLYRTCTRCHLPTPTTAFAQRSDYPHLLKSQCVACDLVRVAAYRHTDAARAQHRARLHARYWADPARARVMATAQHAVHKALRRGTLQRPPQCEECGTPGRVEAAHHDYNRPLDVRWLCKSCHVRWDKAAPKSPSI